MPLPRANPFEYSAVLADEIEVAGGIFAGMLEGGFSPPEMLVFDVEFTSSTAENLEELSKFLGERGYAFNTPKRRRFIPQKLNRHVEGKTNEIRVDEDCLMVWVAEMVRVANAFHSKLGDWGVLYDPKSLNPLSTLVEKPEALFDQGIEHFKNDNLTAAFACFLASTEAASEPADAYDSMGSVALELGLLRLALRHYDRAVQLLPEEPTYRLNRGACRDYLKDYEGALEDYKIAIDKRPNDPDAYFNRGNTYYNRGELGLACASWRQALALGCEQAGRRLEKYCSEGHPTDASS